MPCWTAASRRCNAALCQPHPAPARRQHGVAAQALQQELDTLQDRQGAIVKLTVPYSTPFGWCIKAVGSLPELGNWNVQAAPSLEWTAGDIWVGELRLPPGTHEFKVVVAGPRGEVNWEPCGNRTLEIPDTRGVLDVPCSWGDMQMEILFSGDVAHQQPTRARSPSPVPIPAQIDAAVGLESSDGFQTATVLEPAAAVAAVIQDTFRRSTSRSPSVQQEQLETLRAQSPELVAAQQRSPSVGRGRQSASDFNTSDSSSTSDAADYTQRQTRQALALVTCLSVAVAAVMYYKDPEGFPVSLPTSFPTNLQVSIPVSFPTSLPSISLPTSLPSINLPTSLPNIRLPTSLPAPPTINLPAMFSLADNQR